MKINFSPRRLAAYRNLNTQGTKAKKKRKSCEKYELISGLRERKSLMYYRNSFY